MMRRYSEPAGPDTIKDEFQRVWDALEKIRFGAQEIINSPGFGVDNLFVQPTAPVPPGGTYLWVQTEVGVDNDTMLWVEDGT